MGIFRSLAYGFVTDAVVDAVDSARDARVDAKVYSVEGARERWFKIMARSFTDEQNMLPADARREAARMVQWAEQRAIERGFNNPRGIGEFVLNNWSDYCRCLIDVEGVAVPEIRDLWDTEGIGREIILLGEEQEFHDLSQRLSAEFGLAAADTQRVAWRLTPVYAIASTSAEADPNYTPLPLELRARVGEAARANDVPDWLLKLLRAKDNEEGRLALWEVANLAPTPTYNCWARERIARGAMRPPRFGGR